LDGQNPYLQFAETIRGLVSNAQIVDPLFQIDPISSTSLRNPIKRTQDVQNNLTLLGEYVKINGNLGAFQKKKSGAGTGGGRKSKGKEEDRNPMIWFCFAASFDVGAQYLVDRMTHEWGRLGGWRLQVKSVYSFKTVTPIMCIKLWTETDYDTLIAEFKAILQETWDVERANLTQYGDKLALPEMGIVSLAHGSQVLRQWIGMCRTLGK